MPDPRIPALAAEWLRQKAALLAFDPDLAEDELALMDTLDGMADAGDFIAFWARKARVDEAMADALNVMIGDMTARKGCLNARATKQRDVALCLMEAINERKIIRPDMTITVSPGRQKVIITDETLLPETLFRIRKEPNKTSILEALEQGDNIQGAELGNQTPHLTIRST